MGFVVKQEESLDCLLFVSLYCENYRKDKVFWEQASKFFLSAPQVLEDDDIDYDSCNELSSEKEISYCDTKEAGTSGRKDIKNNKQTGKFFIVSNRGYLCGDYDHKQRH